MRGALVLLLLAVPAYADDGPHKEGQYGGVTPGESPPRDPAAKSGKARRPPAKGTLTWIGFEAKDGGAEVFFQSVAPFELSQRVEAGHLIVRLQLSRLGPNTWRQIDTRFFDNPLAGIVARAVGAARATKDHPARAAGIEARIEFKNAKDAKEATVRAASAADGLYYAYLRFPEGSDPPVAPVRAGTAAVPGALRDPEATEPDSPDSAASEPVDDPPPPPAVKPKSKAKTAPKR